MTIEADLLSDVRKLMNRIEGAIEGMHPDMAVTALVAGAAGLAKEVLGMTREEFLLRAAHFFDAE